jgi:outer membrane protein
MRFHLIVFCVAALAGGAFAAKSGQWSLKQCIDYALEHNIRIKGQHLEATYYQNRYRQSKADLLPEINGYANQNFLFGRTIDPLTNGYQKNNVSSNGFSLDGRVTLFDGLRSIHTIRRNEIDLTASEKDMDHLKNEVIAEVVDAYLMSIYNQEIIEVTDHQLEVTRLQIARTQVLVDAGSVSKGSLYELSALEAQEEVDLLKARNQESISVLTLKQLLELDTLGDFALLPPQLPEINDTDLQAVLPDLYRSALSLPEIERAELSMRSASLDLKIEKEKRFPTLTFDAAMGTGYSGAYKKYQQGQAVDYPFSDQIRDNANTTLSLQLAVPLFSRLQTTNAINNAKITIEKKMLEYETVKKRVLLNVQTAYNDARAALHEYHGNIRVCEASRESFRYLSEKFNVGMVSSVDYHNGKNLLSKAESDLVQSKYKYVLKKSILEVLCGRPVSID